MIRTMIGPLLHGILALSDGAKNPRLNPDTITGSVTLFTLLMAIAVIVGVVTKKLKLPYTVALVLAGLFIAIMKQAPSGTELSPDLVFFIILPPVLFRAGLLIDVENLKRHWVPVAVMTCVGTLLTTFVVGLVLRWFLSPDIISSNVVWVAAFMIGAMVSPTDPVSVMPIIRSIPLPKPVRTVIEGESLFNDGIAVVLFFILYGALFMPIQSTGGGLGPNQSQPVITADTAEHRHTIQGTDVSMSHGQKHGAVVDIWAGILKFLGHTGIGLCIGAIMGWGAVCLMRWANDPVLENTITVVLAYGAFLVSDIWHVSGVASVIVAGIFVGVLRWSKDNAKESERTIIPFWESIDYIMNSLIFLIVGFELQFIGVDQLLDSTVIMASIAIFLAMQVARAIVVYPSGYLLGTWSPRGGTVIMWSGLRGCVTLALVLVLPDNIDGSPDQLKQFVLPVVFGVVLLTLILQATTMRPMISLLGLPTDPKDA